MKLRILALATAVAATMALSASAATLVPPGNRSIDQPQVPGASMKRTKAGKTSFEGKYQKVYNLLANDAKLRSKIKQTAAQYGIDPMHIVGAIVGEHTYNVDAYDRLQTYYVKAAAYLSNSLKFQYKDEDVSEFVQRPQFQACAGLNDSYDLWTCRETVWNENFRGKTVDGRLFPKNRFSAVFFQPLYAGQTFGLGQLNPLTALQMSDIVSRVSGFERLDAGDPNAVYEMIMDPDKSLPYVAATLKKSIESYRSIAGYDISQNPGLTATLYNLGNPEARAYALKAENDNRRAAGEPPKLPEENYYGWLVNEKLAELQALF
ncbi:MAG TPA: DUF1402 family protein [Mesorhizobium sp.]|jgi:hypothetical protein